MVDANEANNDALAGVNVRARALLERLRDKLETDVSPIVKLSAISATARKLDELAERGEHYLDSI